MDTLGVGSFIILTFPRLLGAPVPLPFMLLPVIMVTFLLADGIVVTLDVKFAKPWLDCNGLISAKIMEKNITLRVKNQTFSKFFDNKMILVY